MFKTHIAIAVFAILIFIPHIDYPLIFSIVALVASVLPDIDSFHSRVGNNIIAKPLQFMTKHRGIIHSLTMAVLISLIISFFSPLIALPFFLGYAIHVFTDSFTVDGIVPFWPYKGESKGFLKTGKYSEMALFVVFIVLDLVLTAILFF